MATASRAASCPSTITCSRSPRTTARTTCTAVRAASTPSRGRSARSATGPSRRLRSATSAPTARKATPGRLVVEAVYTLTSERALRVDYTARTDRPTVVNLTQHSYFNLAGHAAGSILGHELRLWASRFLPIDRHGIPSGPPRPVRGTPFDFVARAPIGARISRATTNSCATATATTTASRSTAGTDRCGRSPSSSSRRRDAGCWSAPPSRGCSFTSARTWVAIAGKRGARYDAHTGLLPGGAALSGLAPPPRISVDAPGAGRDLPPDDRVRVPPRVVARR